MKRKDFHKEPDVCTSVPSRCAFERSVWKVTQLLFSSTTRTDFSERVGDNTARRHSVGRWSAGGDSESIQCSDMNGDKQKAAGARAQRLSAADRQIHQRTQQTAALSSKQ